MKTKKYNVIDQETGRLDPTIYCDPDIYKEEMEKVFGRAWLLIGHDSLIPKPGDFFHTYMGEQPVILSRDKTGQVNAMLNICRHRGARVVRTDDGNCKSFVCPYHAWTYGLDGKLEWVPGEEELYDGTIDRAQLGLKRARVATYAGLIFATWDQQAPSLEEYLGDARWYLDLEFNRSAQGTKAFGPHKWVIPINWKTAVDNCSDWYHVPYSHASAANALTRIMGAPRMTSDVLWKKKGRAAFVNGHQVAFFRLPEDSFDGNPYGVDSTAENHREAIERLGELRGDGLMLGTHSLFPNTVLGFRIVIPRGPNETEFWHFSMTNAADTPDKQRAVALEHAAQNGAGGHFESDDIDNWSQVSSSGKYAGAREIGQYVNMGIGNTHTDDVFPGQISDRFVTEQNHRFFYNRWEEFMNADSWDDIPLDPMKATFEGTASMDG
ncbi:SRPBCC family protein [Nocardioides sp. BP30]|uniref:aromatic ring-hydroxylating oxygenase subunit alpha n=1 Tax=Nocardioides sp. BP30 TaxID=3036374 RepID=UPI002468E9F0|nr:Rieske 2Fe-2S domain-containing protein [Nocardioides sp. BP30]WGL50783.1 SRPBCC family protein [Nocardioides sp. BP30]